MTLDELEKLAREAVGGERNTSGMPVGFIASDVIDLCRAILRYAPVIRIAERVVNRGIHRRQDHREVMLRNVELLANDIHILTDLAAAIDAARKEQT